MDQREHLDTRAQLVLLVFLVREVFLGRMEQRAEEEILDLLDLKAMLENREREVSKVLLAHLAPQVRLAALEILALLELLEKQEPLV